MGKGIGQSATTKRWNMHAREHVEKWGNQGEGDSTLAIAGDGDLAHKKNTNTRHIEQVIEMIEFMKGHLLEEVSAETMAQKFELSAPHLRSVFKEVTRLKVHEFLACLRIQQAKTLLLTTQA